MAGEKVRFIFVCSICRIGIIGKEGVEAMTCAGGTAEGLSGKGVGTLTIKGETSHPEVPMVVCGYRSDVTYPINFVGVGQWTTTY